ncbi:tryptophan halogenase family protein [Myxococcus sp. SDU36]|uniref:tryptophan halogenase family protein n=1 Tax=Myxococcus sp. SDU36 TaxID=2831967 RepID=UPI0025428AAC|nr:tryptophan halogenase family protein [Myxococcus sp. SDU36]
MDQSTPESDNRVRKIIIVGGGSSGWMAAAYLNKALNFNVDITLVESPNIPRIGVGEATIPTIKEELFDFLEIPEEEWMAECKATYKLGIRFQNWKKPASQGGDHYYHNFGEMPQVKGVPLSHIWMYSHQQRGFAEPMEYTCYPTSPICDAQKSPRYMDGTKAVHYAYHFDALLMANYLKKWSIERNLTYISDDIVETQLDEGGSIKALRGASGRLYEADLYIDCSGFAGLLIEKALGEPKITFHDCLLTDRAVALNVPSDPTEEGIRPYTTATAFSSGWTWEIPLYGRSGNGYVYSSAFQTAEDAERELRSWFGKKADALDARHIRFISGRRRRSWVKNCVSFGLASSFLEPLESTGLYFVYAALYQLVACFPNKQIEPALRDKFNERVSFMVDDVRDFIVLHFCTSPRTDTPYWRANQNELKLPDTLKEVLELQRAGIPIRKSYHSNEALYSSFEAGFDRFWTNSNFQSIFAGVGYLPRQPMPLLHHRPDILMEGERMFDDIRKKTAQMMSRLPSQYDYLTALYARGERTREASR